MKPSTSAAPLHVKTEHDPWPGADPHRVSPERLEKQRKQEHALREHIAQSLQYLSSGRRQRFSVDDVVFGLIGCVLGATALAAVALAGGLFSSLVSP